MKKTTILLVLSLLTIFLLNISELNAGNFLKKIAGETTVNTVSVFTEKAVPEAAFQADLTLIPEGNSINFTDQSTGTPTTWTWTFTGGTPATYSGKVPPPIYYNTAGTYNVSLTVINGDGSDTETKTDYITVAEYPSGWDFTQTATSHLISIKTNVIVSGAPLTAGDFLGVFYLDESSVLKCGGATIWDGTHNKVVVAFGDDATTTPLKEGFASAESFVWKVYYHSMSLEATATVTYDQNLPNKDGKFADLGLSALTSIVTNTGVLSVVAEATPNSVCIGSSVQLNANVSGGSGTYTYSWTSDPAGFTSSIQNPTATPSVNTTYYVTVYDGPTSASSSVSVTTQATSTANAGSDASICQGLTHTLSGTATNYGSVAWSTSGNGTFSSTSSLTPVYTPGSNDITAGTVTLTLSAVPISPCSVTAIDAMVLIIQKTPVVNAGSDGTVCQTSTHTLAGTASYYTSVLWSTSGNGTFSNASLLNAVYTPGSLDIAAGTATLTLTAQPVSPCAGAVSDTKILTVRKSPTSNAGIDATICQNGTHQLAGEATNYNTISWVTSGNGTFSSTSSLTPVYTPGSTDINNGNVLLTMTATAQSPCTGSVSDSKILTIRKTPVVNAGNDATICQGSTHTLSATASNYANILWTTSGNGTFSSTSSLTPIYTPGSNDIAAGTVTLTLTAQPNSPCSGAVADAKVVVIQKLPTASAGNDDTICETGTHTLQGSATYHSSVLWTTTGNGTFSSTSSLTPVYTPGSTEIASGTVTLTLTASAVSPCSTSANDAMVLSIVKSPTANAGIDATICQGSTHSLSGTASNYASFLWITSGNGTFSSTSSLNPVYTPGSEDITNGTVQLCLTAQPNAPCTLPESDCLDLTIQLLAVASAGVDQTVCPGETASLSGASATNYSSVLWTTGGDGTFSDDTSINPLYYPGPTEITAGNATLTLTANSFVPCVISDDDFMILSIINIEAPTCPASFTVCFDEPGFELSGGTPEGGIYSGTGVTDNTFYPAVAGTGEHTITYTYSSGNCENSCTFTITVNSLPDVICPADFAVCEDDPAFELSGAEPEGGIYTGEAVEDNYFNPASAQIGENTITYTFTDGNNCTGSCEFTITVNPRPDVTCPADMNVCIDAPEFLLTGATPEGGTYSGNGVDGGFFYPSVAGAGLHGITYYYTDGNGCQNSCQFYIFVNDVPEVTCPDDVYVCENQPAFVLSGGSPEGGTYTGQGVSEGVFDPQFVGMGEYEITYSFTEPGTGCDESCTFYVIVNQIPTVTCPSDMVVCMGDESFELTGAEPGDGEYSGPGVSDGMFDPALAGTGDHLITYTYTDYYNCSNSCTFTITVNPEPEIECPADITVNNDPELCGADVSFEAVVFNGNVDYWVGNEVITSPWFFPVGTTTVDAKASSDCGEAICSFSVTVSDNQLPIIICPEDVTVFTDPGQCFATGVELGSPETSDNCSIASVINDAEEPFAIGTTVVTWAVTDGTGNIATCTQNVTVIDAEAPSITCPADVIIPADAENCYATGVELGTPVTSDNCEVASTVKDTVEPFPVGTTTVTWTVTDGSGNIATCTQNVTVEDMEPPVVTCPGDVTVYTDEGFCYATGVELGLPEIFDNCSILSYENDAVEPFEMGITIVTWTITDGSGNISSCEQTVFVFSSEPTAYAGNDATISDGDSYTLSGATATNYASILWTTNGDGAFDDFSTLNPTYTPGITDVANGFVELTITVTGYCDQDVSNAMILTINPAGCLEPPTVFAGGDATICEGEAYTILDASATNYSALQWYTTTGSGYFDDETLLNATYYPNGVDLIQGSVELCLMASPSDQGCEMVYDCFILTINHLPLVNCPADFAVCVDEPAFVLSGATPDGGIYSGSGVLNGMFDAAMAEVGSHEITYTYTESGCENSCTFWITVNPLPDVYCPSDFAVCVDAEAFELTGAEPVGGIYSGTGVADGYFNPSLAGTGDHIITYTFTDGNGCSNFCTFAITVNPLPDVTCPQNMTVCVDAPEFELSGGIPAGGEYSGTGVNGGFFYPALAGVGQHLIEYTVTDQNGCVNSCEFIIEVINIPTVTCPADFAVCVDEPAFVLSGATPDGGIYSGSGVLNGMFDAAVAEVGSHEITYTYTEGGCENSCTFWITVNPLPDVYCPSDFAVCVDAEAFELTGAEPVGGIYSGTGVADGYFNPSLAGTGDHIITYTFTDGNGCSNFCTFTITVNPLPDVTCPQNMTVCVDASEFELSGGIPAGGEYSGTGVNGGFFYPALAGVGQHVIEYTVTDQNGCVNSCEFIIEVINIPTVTCPADFAVCVDEPAFVLSGATPDGGIYSGSGVLNGMFDAALAEVGSHEITYTYTEGGCENSCTFWITVNPLPDVYCPSDFAVCLDAEAFELTGAEPVGGIYSGTGVSDGFFNPALAGTGDHTITYTFTDGNGCSNFCTFTITVNPLPDVTCPQNMTVCVDAPEFELSGGIPAGGEYSGTGVNGGFFYPGVAGVGQHVITYTVADLNGCVNSCEFIIEVINIPTVNCPADFAVCVDEPAFVLSGATPDGGIYSGSGVLNGMFDAAMAEVGSHEITYTYTEGGCENSCTFWITVNPLPDVYCLSDFAVCVDAEALELSGATPENGIYSGTGVADGYFNPALAGTGDHIITYTFTDGNGCSNFCTFTITVNPLPDVTCPQGTTVCVDAPEFELSGGIPAGGEYSGTGVNGGFFYPALAGVGQHVVLYTVSDQNGCVNSCEFIIEVINIPTVNCPANFAVCVDEPAFVLSGATPDGGIYSGSGVLNGMFDAAVAEVGSHEITYTYTEGGCENSCTFWITVNPLPDVYCPSDFAVCVDAEAFELTGAEPIGGVYSGTGVADGYFNPALAGTGDHIITYTFTDGNGCSNFCTFTITVNPLPDVTCPQNMTVCVDASEFELSGGIPAGGEYSGTGVNGGFFYPALAGVGQHVVTYTVADLNGCVNSCEFIIEVINIPTVTCPADFAVCVDEPAFVLSGATPDGGIYSGSGVLNGMFDAAVAEVGSHEITYTYTSAYNCTNFCTFTISVAPVTYATAGPDAMICSGYSYTIFGATASDNCGLNWTTSGDGTFDDAASLNPTYTPGMNDQLAGSVILCLVVQPCAPCTNVITDCLTLTIQALPTAFGGNDATIPGNGNVQLFEATATNFAALVWTTSGNGTFSNPTTINPTYYPGTEDILAGFATLCLTAQPVDPCTVEATDCMDLTIGTGATVYAGQDAYLCGVSDYFIADATAENYASLLWNSSGDGTFGDATILNPVYYFGANDIANGTAELCLTAQPIPPSTVVVTDCLLLTLALEPIANAGIDATICSGEQFTTAADVENACLVTWQSSGDGTFIDVHLVNTTYLPGTADLATGSVELCITAQPCNPCTNVAFDCLTLHFEPSATANAGNDGTICQNKTFAVSGTSGNACGVLWSTTGDGTFANSSLAATTYTPGAADIATGSVSLCFSALPCSPCQSSVTDCLTLSVRHLPLSNAGPDAAVCAGSSYTLSGSTQYSCSNLWTRTGDGTFNNAGFLNAVYTPGQADIAAGSVNLCLRALPCNPCSVNTTDCMTLYIYKNPTANAGADATVCDNEPYSLTGSATLQCGQIWNSYGDGTFDDNTLLNATYSPGPNDQLNGGVTLCLTAVPCSPCSVPATDCLDLTYLPSPVAFAGDDATLCENTPFTLTGIVLHSCGNVWTTTGDGTFDNNQSLTAIYLPGADDVANGWVEICLTASACSPCTLSTSDCLILNIQKTPEVFAGSDATINSGNTFVPVDATASDYASLLWSTAGDGVFDAPGSLHPVYTPGDNDIENISVELCLTALPLNPCTASASDCLILSIGSIPVVTAGTDQTICEGGNYWIEFAEASNYSSLNWTTSGDGTFDFDNTLNPVYTPGPTDIQIGIADLCLTAQPIPPTTFPVTDCMSLSIWKNPVVVAGDDAVICEGQTYILNAQVENSCGIIWETMGDGVFENIISPVTMYQPGVGDIAAGSVELCLTATACNPCTIPVMDCLILTIQPLSSAFAGEDVTICENGSASLSGTVENACGLTWSTSGDGFFDDNTSQYATYFPGPADLNNGSAELCLTAFSCNPCQDLATDCLTVFFSPEPEVLVGDDITICEGLSILLWPLESNNCGLLWTTSGDGVFENPAEPITVYTPGPADVEAGYADICLTAFACEPCTQPATDCFTMYIQLPPTVFAGNDLTVCEGNFVNLTEASGENYSEVIWTTTNGTGNFENENILNTIYYPGILDLLLGCIDLQVVALPINPCSTGANDDISVCFQKNPTVYAGEDALVCTDTEISLSGIIENACGSIWTTSGDGFFDNLQSANAVYTPGQGDINTGSVELCLTAFACDPCTDDASDCIFISFQLPPTVNAGNDFTVCEGSIVALSEATAENFGSFFWMSINGTGNFENENELNTNYYPSMTDYIQGCVTHVLMVSPINPCETGTTDDITICFQKSPYAYAGEDAAICAGTTVNVMGTVTNSCGFYWYSEGDGVFDNPNSLTVIYTPGANDIALGFVALKLVAEPCAPCNEPSIDDIELYITQPPTPFQLADASICEGEVYCFDVYVENYSSLEWTGGEGFDDPSSMTPCYTPTAEDFANGFVELCLTLSPVSPCELPVTDCMTLTLFGGQQIVIPQGWSGLSSYIEAVNPDVEAIMSAIENEIIVMNDLIGNVFIPSENVNTIGNWNNYAGYTIKVTEEVTLNICGSPVDNRTLDLSEGWNLIPVLSENDVLSSDIFNQITGKLIIAKEVAGVQLYYPAYQIYTLQSLHSGKAYYVKVSEDCSVIFPVNAGKSELIPEPGQIRNITPWNDVRYSPGTHIFVLPADIPSGFAPGSVIGAFNGEGYCSGMVEIVETNKTTALIVTGSDTYEKNHTGLAVGENVTFRLYDPATSTVSELFANVEDGSAFTANGISVFKSLQISGVSQIEKAQVTIWPNPATDYLKISIVGIQTAYSVELYDSYGSNVLKYNEMEGISNIDLSTISSGVYLIKVVYQNYTYTQKVIVQ